MTVSRDEWRDQFYADTKVKEPAIMDDTLRTRFNRAIGELVKSQQIGTLGKWFWLDSRTTLDMSGHWFFVRTILAGLDGQVFTLVRLSGGLIQDLRPVWHAGQSNQRPLPGLTRKPHFGAVRAGLTLPRSLACGRQRGPFGHVETNGSFPIFWRQRPLRQMKPTVQTWLAGGTA